MKPRKYRAKSLPQFLGSIDGIQQYTKSEWVYGYYAPIYLAEVDGQVKNTYCIISDDTVGTVEMYGCGHYTGLPKAYNIIEDTVSQSTGKRDVNGKEIFEGDIVKGTISSAWEKGEIICEVRFENDGYYCIERRQNNEYQHKLMFSKKLEVIGNIWDNPNLIEEPKVED